MLRRSRHVGEPVRLGFHRTFLQPAVRLGIRPFHVFVPRASLLGEWESCRYVCGVLEPSLALPPGLDAQRLASPAAPLRRGRPLSPRQLHAIDA